MKKLMSQDGGKSVLDWMSTAENLPDDIKSQIEDLLFSNRRQKFGLVWEDSTESVVEELKANIPYLKEIEPRRISCGDAEGPQNLLIEGDNYHALKLLQATHKGRINLIYIDPPYNTGNKDFVYNDEFIDKENGYRHSKWLSFMHKRLVLAKELMSDDGVIFISIDDNEMARLKLLCDEVFGADGFISTIVWQKSNGKNDAKTIRNVHEYTLIYSKLPSIVFANESLSKEYILKNYKNPDNDRRGEWMALQLYKTSNSKKYKLVSPTGKEWNMPWNYNEVGMKKLIDDDLLYWGKNGDACPRKKIFLKDSLGTKTKSVFLESDCGGNQKATNELKNIMGGKVFSYPKPTSYIKKIISLLKRDNLIVLDFFAGSGTTGHAVLELNKEDGGNRQFILCTNNEVSDEKTCEYFGLSKKELTLFRQTKEYGSLIKEDSYQELGICRAITYQRLNKVINGYTTPKGDDVPGISANLQYLQVGLMPLEGSSEEGLCSIYEPHLLQLLKMKHQAYHLVERSEFGIVYENEALRFGLVNEGATTKDFELMMRHLGQCDKTCLLYLFSTHAIAYPRYEQLAGLDEIVRPIPREILNLLLKGDY